ncbi:hypothetical protein ACFPRL_23010 [Pseudoclavibacter helvolus]
MSRFKPSRTPSQAASSAFAIRRTRSSSGHARGVAVEPDDAPSPSRSTGCRRFR